MPRSLPPLLLLLLLLACEAERLAQQESNKPRSSPFPVEPSKSFPRGGGSGGGRRWQRAYMKVFGREGHYRDGATGAAAAWLDLVSSLDQTSPSLRGTRLISAGESRHEMGAVQPKMPAAMETSEERDDNSMAALVMRRARSMRGRRGTVDNQKGVKPKRKRLGKAAVDLRTLLEAHHVGWEAVPRPLALNQSTHSPLDTTRSLEFTFLDTSFRDTTSLVPLGTEEKALDVKNPFYPMGSDSYRAYAIMCVSIVIFTVGIIGNIAIMCIVCHNYYMRSISNSLLANLALWDFLIIFFCLPMATFHELTKQWLMGDFSCKIIPYLEVASLGVTTFTLCALCIDRFRAATNVQMYYEMIESCASTTAKLAVIWVGALLLALPELLIRQLVTEEGEAAGVAPCQRCALRISPDLPDGLYVLGLTYEGARLWWCFGCYFCLPTLFTIGSSLATARKIRQAERAAVRGSKKQIRLESQMNCTVVALAILYGLCVVPENVCGMVAGSISAALPRPTLELLQLISQTLLFLKSALTPALLLCLCRPFGRALLECCCCCCGGGGDCGGAKSSAGASEDNDHECTTELELSPFSTIRRDASTCAAVGTRC